MTKHLDFNVVFEDNSWEKAKILPVLIYPNEILTTVADPVTNFDESLKVLCADMIKTMYRYVGVGLAAPQIGISQRIFVTDTEYSSENKILDDESSIYYLKKLNPKIIINPEFIEKRDKSKFLQEGCLSLPGIYEVVERYEYVKVRYQDEHGEFHEVEGRELLGVCLQHEVDHLDGIVTLDRLGNLKKSFYKKKLIKFKKNS